MVVVLVVVVLVVVVLVVDGLVVDGLVLVVLVVLDDGAVTELVSVSGSSETDDVAHDAPRRTVAKTATWGIFIPQRCQTPAAEWWQVDDL